MLLRGLPNVARVFNPQPLGLTEGSGTRTLAVCVLLGSLKQKPQPSWGRLRDYRLGRHADKLRPSIERASWYSRNR